MNQALLQKLLSGASPEDFVSILEAVFGWYTSGSGTATLNPPIEILGKQLAKITFSS